ncbi:MAG: winged helix-turn-helix transcriptional regulator [Pirellula sp.]
MSKLGEWVHFSTISSRLPGKYSITEVLLVPEMTDTPIKYSEAPVRPVDQLVLDLLRREEGLSVTDLMERLEVTATAIRQRLDRLEESGFIERRKQSVGRGRPSYNYFLTDLGWRQAGVTYSDFAISMWNEICSLSDASLKTSLIDSISHRMGHKFREMMPDAPLEERMRMMAGLLSNRKIPTCITSGMGLPVLEVQACPYPDLAGNNSDRSVCALETKVISEALGQDMELSQCRLDGHSCCQFKPTSLAVAH